MLEADSASAFNSFAVGVINFDYNSLLSLYQAKTGSGAGGSAMGGLAGTQANGKKAPVAPWSIAAKPPEASERVKRALANEPILDVEAAKKKLPKNQEDYAELFALYNAFDTLKALTDRMAAKNLPSVERSQIERRYEAGLKDVNAFVAAMDFDKANVVRGVAVEGLKSSVAFKREQTEFRTRPLHTGAMDAPVEAWTGDVRFSMEVRVSASGTKTIQFDLAEMGSTPRDMGAVVAYMNGKLKDEGLLTRFSREKLPGEPRTVQTRNGAVKLPDGPDRYALKIAGVSTEKISFDAPDRADAVYLAQAAGKDGALARHVTKFQTDAAVGSPPPAHQATGEANWVDGRVFAQPLSGNVTVRASAAHTDGSVYMVAEVDGAVANQTIKGERDVALLKYDASGALVFSRTLGAAGEASATSIAISADGQVAIGGSLKGELGGVAASDTRNLDSFVTVFDAEGDELWTRRGGSQSDDDVRAMTWGPDGTLYVSGQTKGAFAADSMSGGADAWLRAYKSIERVAADGSRSPDAQLLFTHQYGTAGDDAPAALAVENGVLVAAGSEGGRAVLRRFDLQPSGAPVAGAVADLGALEGGRIAGLSLAGGRVTVAGSTTNAAMNAGLQLSAHSGGGQDIFLFNLGDDLNTGAASLTYWGGSGEEQLGAVSLRGAEVYVTGSTNGALGGLEPIGARDGFVARLNAVTGQQEWARRFTGKDGEVSPSAIAVGRESASVLDRLGLPRGEIDYLGSQKVTAGTSARVGDHFFVRAGRNGRETAIRVEGEILQAFIVLSF